MPLTVYKVPFTATINFALLIPAASQSDAREAAEGTVRFEESNFVDSCTFFDPGDTIVAEAPLTGECHAEAPVQATEAEVSSAGFDDEQLETDQEREDRENQEAEDEQAADDPETDPSNGLEDKPCP